MTMHNTLERDTTPVVAPERLRAADERGWRRGFSNLLRKEFSLWWHTRKWWVHLLIWLALINGMALMVMLLDESPPAQQYGETINVFFMLGALATGIGIVTASQGAIVSEKQLGTAAWVMSKPASRAAFVLSKLVAAALSFLTLAVAAPGLVFYGQSLALFGQAPDPARFLASLGVVALHVLFYLALTLLLGTLFGARGPVTGIAIGFLFAGMMVSEVLPQIVTIALPWHLARVAVGLAQASALPAIWPIPLIATALWTALFVAVALWRFGREEF